jgi:hypothetical protein
VTGSPVIITVHMREDNVLVVFVVQDVRDNAGVGCCLAVTCM